MPQPVEERVTRRRLWPFGTTGTTTPRLVLPPTDQGSMSDGQRRLLRFLIEFFDVRAELYTRKSKDAGASQARAHSASMRHRRAG